MLFIWWITVNEYEKLLPQAQSISLSQKHGNTYFLFTTFINVNL